MALPKKTVELLRRRDPHCYHCGQTEDLVPHHRKNKGMGGSKLLDTPDNLMMVCSRYNGDMESNPRVAQQARAWNHKLPVWESTDWPVFDMAGGWWFLLRDGNRVRMTGDIPF
jgi:5-methylcytosine-specific restriction endonuclease McrA